MARIPRAASEVENVKEDAKSILTRWESFGELQHEMRCMQREMDRPETDPRALADAESFA